MSGFLLQNAKVITKYGNFITKCNNYYKMQCLLQIATVHPATALVLLTQLLFFEILFHALTLLLQTNLS